MKNERSQTDRHFNAVRKLKRQQRDFVLNFLYNLICNTFKAIKRRKKILFGVVRITNLAGAISL